MITTIILIALAVAFTVLFLTKTLWRYKLRDWADTKKYRLFANMLDCDFCLCFWLSALVCGALSLISFDFKLILFPIFTTPLARLLL